jgi:hypothetical protein
MSIAAYGIGAYRRTAGRLPEVKLVNMYVEASGADPDEPVVLLYRPGLKAYDDMGSGPVRGVFSKPGVFSGAVFAVVGDGLYRDGSLLGTVPGTGRVSMAASSTELLVANGLGLYRTAGTTVAAVTFPDTAGVSSVAFINNQFVASRASSPRFYWSAVGDGSTWDAADYATAERAPDNLRAVWVVGDELWPIGDGSFEFWQPTGDLDLPFERVGGRYYNRGSKARDTIADLAGSVAFVGDDGKVYFAAGDNEPTPISDSSVEERIANTADADLSAFSFTFQGHRFYLLKTDQGSFGFDADTKQWCEFASYERDSFRAWVGCQLGDRVIVGDDESNALWELDADTYLDGSVEIQRFWTAAVPAEGKPFHCFNLHLDIAVGATTDLDGTVPYIERRFSRDGGQTWTAWARRSMGLQGAYRTRPTWLGEGLVDEPGRVMEFRTTAKGPIRLSGIRYNDLGGSMAR